MRIKLLKAFIRILEKTLIIHLKYLILIDKRQAKKIEYVKEIIKTVCKQEEVNSKLALAVAYCESRYNIKAIRKNTNGTIDRGLFQWNDFYHPEITDQMAYDPEIATRAFCKAEKQNHLNWWNASRPCWSKIL